MPEVSVLEALLGIGLFFLTGGVIFAVVYKLFRMKENSRLDQMRDELKKGE